MMTWTKQTNTDNAMMFTLTTVGVKETLTTPTTVTTPQVNTDKSPPTPSGPQSSSTSNVNMQPDGKYNLELYTTYVQA